MKTAVIIPNWNGRRLLSKSLPAVLRVGSDEIIIVDDASSDDSVSFIRKRYPEVKLILNKKNLGFAATVNRGVQAAHADVVFLFNSDVYPHKDILKYVLPHFRNREVFGVSFNEGKFGWVKPKIEDGFLNHSPGEDIRRAHQTFWVSGGSGAFRKSMWNKLGGMDEIFTPFYWEDVDLSFRALRMGWKLVWEPRAKVNHQHEATINTAYFSQKYLVRIKERNHLIFQWKNLSVSWLLVKHLPSLLYRARKPGYFLVVLMALSKLPQIILRRMEDFGKYKFTDEEVIQKFQN